MDKLQEHALITEINKVRASYRTLEVGDYVTERESELVDKFGAVVGRVRAASQPGFARDDHPELKVAMGNLMEDFGAFRAAIEDASAAVDHEGDEPCDTFCDVLGCGCDDD